ncbi:hypothetical protein C8J57DRAFT_1122747 [Mycena rebaudengoi]|nr:hypothetical protein C8J57DRAFT_1122747 [Mycena rebaudengoi]
MLRLYMQTSQVLKGCTCRPNCLEPAIKRLALVSSLLRTFPSQLPLRIAMSSDLESLVVISQDAVESEPSSHLRKRRTNRSHPRVTGYRIVFFILTGGFGSLKAFFAYRGESTTPTTLDWVYGVVVVYILYWLGLYEEDCPEKFPHWMFQTDLVESANDNIVKIKYWLARCRDISILNNIRAFFRKIGGTCEPSADPEDSPNLRDVSFTADSTGEATGIQLHVISGGTSWITHRSYDSVQHPPSRRNPNARPKTETECDYCEYTFSSTSALHDHCRMKKDHPYCEPCEILFMDEHALQQHTRDAAAHRICEPCDRQFCDREALCKHLAASSRHEWCFGCWQDFDDHAELRKHCVSSHRGKGGPTVCPLCDDTFKNPIVIGPHITSGCQ